LSFFRPSLLDESNLDDLERFIENLNEFIPSYRKTEATSAWKKWLETYAKRIQNEDPMDWKSEGGIDWLDVREASMKSVNPRFVLRQWVLQEVIVVCQEGDLQRSRAVLGKILEVSYHLPFARLWEISNFIVDGNLSVPHMGW
jgi:serine/tyrosine/threonine adenylyltransferase